MRTVRIEFCLSQYAVGTHSSSFKIDRQTHTQQQQQHEQLDDPVPRDFRPYVHCRR